uniref:Glutaredoxin-3 n=1 Tax=Xenopus tropicalis TaxID=8364 RepID=F6ZFE9_XENTR
MLISVPNYRSLKVPIHGPIEAADIGPVDRLGSLSAPVGAETRGNATSCPEVRDGTLGICGRECTEDTGCEQGWKCCPNTCGKFSCMNPEWYLLMLSTLGEDSL